jgi:hypothetical protein
MHVHSYFFVFLRIHVSLGKIFVVEEQPNAKGSTPNVDFKVELPDLFTLCFMHEFGVVVKE